MPDHAADLRFRVLTNAIESVAKPLVTGHALEETLEVDSTSPQIARPSERSERHPRLACSVIDQIAMS